jgi:hypothetical protein
MPKGPQVQKRPADVIGYESDKWMWVGGGMAAGWLCYSAADLLLIPFGKFDFPSWTPVLMSFVGMFLGFLIFKFLHRQDRPRA